MLSACGPLPDFFDGIDQPQARRASVASLDAPAPGGHPLYVFDMPISAKVPGPVSFAGLSVCDAAAIVLGDELELPYTCEGGSASVALFWAGGDPVGLYRTFSALVARTGGTVRHDNRAVHVAAGENNAGGMSGTPPAGSTFTRVSGVHSFTFETQAAPSIEPRQLISSRVELVPLPAGVTDADIRQVSAEFGLDVRPWTIAGRSFAVVPAELVGMVGPLLDAASTVTVPVELGTASAAQIAAYEQNHPALTFRHDVDQGVLWLTGPTGSAYDFVTSAPGVGPASDYRVTATFVSLRETASRGFDASLGLGLTNGRFAILSRGGGSELVRVVIDAAVTSGSARVISEPTLSVRAGSSGRFVSGQSVPVQIAETRDGEERRTTTTYRDTGVVLRVEPRPTLRGTVRLLVHLEISTVAESAGVGGNPVFDTQEITSEIEVQPGDTVVLSGLMTASETRGRSSGLRLSSSASGRREDLRVFVRLERDG